MKPQDKGIIEILEDIMHSNRGFEFYGLEQRYFINNHKNN